MMPRCLSMPTASSLPLGTPARNDPNVLRVARVDRCVWVFLILGTLLRLIWPLDMEWKFDEKWMFAKGLSIAQGHEAWPWLGMPSGVGLRNPGMSIWPFGVIAHLVPSPVGMMFTIAVLNTLG